MTTNHKLVATVAAVAIVQKAKSRRLKKKTNKFAQLNVQLAEQVVLLETQLEYLGHMLDSAGYEINEFDKIALMNPDLNSVK